MTRTLTECPTCHERIPFVWHGHHAVASSPEDDDPWCKHCNRPLDEFRSDNPADYCAKVGNQPEPDEGWTDEQLAADDARVRAERGDDPNDNDPGHPIPGPWEWF